MNEHIKFGGKYNKEKLFCIRYLVELLASIRFNCGELALMTSPYIVLCLFYKKIRG